MVSIYTWSQSGGNQAKGIAESLLFCCILGKETMVIDYANAKPIIGKILLILPWLLPTRFSFILSSPQLLNCCWLLSASIHMSCWDLSSPPKAICTMLHVMENANADITANTNPSHPLIRCVTTACKWLPPYSVLGIPMPFASTSTWHMTTCRIQGKRVWFI